MARKGIRALLAAAVVAAMAGCGDQESGAPPADGTVSAVVPLAKAEGWRADLPSPGDPFALAEIAYDRDTAERAWEENVPQHLPASEGEPADPGRYGDLADIDFDTHALVIWSSGESGTCPAWLTDITMSDGAVEVSLDSTAGPDEACTSDYRPYRLVLAVDRDRLPEPDELPVNFSDGVPDGRLERYPAD